MKAFNHVLAGMAVSVSLAASAHAQLAIRPAFAGGVSIPMQSMHLDGSFTFANQSRRLQARAEFFVGDRDPLVLASVILPKDFGRVQPYLLAGVGAGLDNRPHPAWAFGAGIRLPEFVSAPIFIESRMKASRGMGEGHLITTFGVELIRPTRR